MKHLSRRYLAVLLAAMGLGQAFSFGDFVDIVATYDVFGAGGSGFAVVIIGAELAAAALLVWPRATPPRHRIGAVVALVVALAWTVLGVQAFARGLQVDNCGCFGRFLSQPLRWWVLAQDAYFVLLPLLVIRSSLSVPAPSQGEPSAPNGDATAARAPAR